MEIVVFYVFGLFPSVNNQAMIDTKTKKHPPAVPSWEILFSQFRFVQNPLAILQEGMDRFGGFYSTWLALNKLYFTDRPEVIRHILQKNHRNYKKSKFVKILAAQIGYGLLTSDGAYWLRQRRLIQPGFHRKKLEGLVGIMQEQTLLYAEELEKTTRNQALNLGKEMMKATLLVVTKSLFSSGIEDRDLKTIDYAMGHLQNYIITQIRRPYYTPFLKLTGKKRFYESLGPKVDKIIYKIIEDRQKNGTKHDDLMDMLLNSRYEDTGEGMNLQQLRDESLVLFLAGHETSALALTWTFYLLVQHPEIEAKVLAEAKAVLGDKEASFETLMQLTYTKQVLQEAMRLYPPAWIMDREAIDEDEIEGYHVPKGANISLFVYGVHHNPDYWEAPETFDPDRFTKEKIKTRRPFTYFPFGGGPRLCIGNQFAYMEMQLILATLIQRFRFELVENQVIELEPLITLRPKNGIFVRAIRR